MLPTINIATQTALPDTTQWQFRFEIKSASSNRIYVIAQHKYGRYWGCSCPGWKAHRHCKHLTGVGLPGDLLPCEPNIIKS